MLEFQQKYIEDAGELIAKLESQLIIFENDAENEEIKQELFRVMHTLKGTSGMFGFNRIEKFTHLLEDIYDLIRNNELSINQDIINLTFNAVDILKLLLETKENLDSEQEKAFDNILSEARKYTDKEIPIESPETKPKQKDQGIYLFHVIFRPKPEIVLRGINPEYIVEELTGLGKNIQFQFTDESIEMVDESTFNQYWELFLTGDIAQEEVEEAFLFINESDYSIETLTDSSEDAINKFLSTSLCIENKISIDELKKQVKEILVIPEKKPEPPKETVEKPEPPKETIEKSAQPTVSDTSEETIRVSARKLDNLLNLVSELIIVHAQYENHSERIQDEQLVKTTKNLSKISRNFRDEILTTRLIPIAVLATSMKRLVRDLEQKLGKEIELITEGLQTELDKNIISQIENPIMHIIRNSVDHGLETPEERVKNNKPSKGVIRFIAFYEGASVFIQIQDDGRGIDTKMIFDKAVSKGIVKYDDELTTKEIYDLIFIPGFSTVYQISEVSGRGVGLDVVKNTISDLHGEINIDSEIGLGTSFTFKLPLTLSIVDALLVLVNNFKILIPTSNILTCKYIPSDFFADKDLQYQLDEKCIPVKRLSEVFSTTSNTNGFEVLIIISIYEKLFGLLVDKIASSLQAVIKPLGQMEMSDKQSYFVGASQLGDGSTAYILDTNFLLKI